MPGASARLSSRDEAVAILVEDFEGFPQLLLGVGVLRHGQAVTDGPWRRQAPRQPVRSVPGAQTFIFLAIRFRNSGKSIVPLPSASTSLIMSCSSASVGFWPRERITVPNSLVVIVPARAAQPVRGPSR